ncbi:MAG: GNAT family N-acetyltransferase [Methanomicrobiaceae archaeon]|nr:GNAT family N-acetyltransferase [Methanomicrobiaceae archaeon]
MTGAGMNNKIAFREVTDGELEAMNLLVNNEDIARYLDLIPPVPMSKTIDFRNFAASRGAMWWCILKGNDIIGSIGIVPEDSEGRMSHVGVFFIYIKKEYWGVGYGGLAVDYALAHAGCAGLKRVECIVSTENRRAIALYEKKGFRLEGVKKEAFFDGERYSDVLMMGKIL